MATRIHCIVHQGHAVTGISCTTLRLSCGVGRCTAGIGLCLTGGICMRP